MARSYLCDGCGGSMASPDLVLGHVYKREYCPACAPIASAYLARLENSRRELVEHFKSNKEYLREEFLAQIKTLPDDPDRVPT